jgi:thiamine-phosphate pyrophosphorylase
LLLYYITDRTQFSGDKPEQRRRLLSKIGEAAVCGVDYIQLREKDLSARELEEMAHEAVRVLRASSGQTKLLINSRSDVALAVDADGVHLRSEDVSVRDARSIATRCGAREWIVGISCHSEEHVARAAAQGADFAVFAPVFAKRDAPNTPSTGIEGLRRACQHKVPVLALGGVTMQNARACIEAGAAGIAGIRLFQDRDMAEVVSAMRGLI